MKKSRYTENRAERKRTPGSDQKMKQAIAERIKLAFYGSAIARHVKRAGYMTLTALLIS